MKRRDGPGQAAPNGGACEAGDSTSATSHEALLVQQIRASLRGSLTERGADQWLRARNRMLGGRRPIDLVREGQVELVSRAAAAFVDGAYV